MANETDTGSRLRRKISQARLALGVERLWSVLLWPALILGTAAVAVLSGALPFLPPWLRALLATGLPERLRVLGGMVAMAGLLTFAWSTSVLLVLAQDFQREYLKGVQGDASAKER